MAATVAGGIVGAALGLYSAYEQNKSQKAQLKLAEQQYELAKQEAEYEDQERNKANQKEVDIEGLLSENTESGFGEANLTGALGASDLTKNPLNKKSRLLGEYSGS